MTDTYKKFYVGINVFLVQDGKLLLGKRKNIFGDGTWGLVGGHLEPGERMLDAAARELFEETGLTAKRFIFNNLVNNRSTNEHRLQIGFLAEDFSGEIVNKEPDRCAELSWFPFKSLPENLFPPHKEQIASFMEGSVLSDM